MINFSYIENKMPDIGLYDLMTDKNFDWYYNNNTLGSNFESSISNIEDSSDDDSEDSEDTEEIISMSNLNSEIDIQDSTNGIMKGIYPNLKPNGFTFCPIFPSYPSFNSTVM